MVNFRSLLFPALMMLPLASVAPGADQPLTVAGPIRDILVVGDSITQHAPSTKLGWSGSWGMAASASERDWAHLLQARLNALPAGAPTVFHIDAEGGGKVRDKLKRLAAITANAADLIIIQLGENDNTAELAASFEADYELLLTGLRAAYPQARLLCFGVWTGASGISAKDAVIRVLCGRHGADFVEMAAINADPANRAGKEGGWTNPGVAWHPGDRGMAAYAEAAWAALQRPVAPGPVVTAPPAAAVLPTLAVPPAPAVGAHDDVVFTADFSDAQAVAKTWRGPGAIEEGAWKISQSTPASAKASMSIPVERIAGKRVKLSVRLRSEEISARPKAWNGIKVLLATTNAEGEKWYPQLPTTDTVTEWTVIEKTFDIPANVVRTDALIGLENVSGTAWFDDLRLEIVANP